MADEIIVLESNGGPIFTLFLIFPIPTPVQTGVPTPTNVIPTPATVDGISVLPITAEKALTQMEKDAFNAGTSAFRVVPLNKKATLTVPQFTVAIRAKYAAEKAAFDKWYAQAYRHSGLRLDEV